MGINESSKERFLELDLLRGLAAVGMIIFHFFYLLDYFDVVVSEMFSGWWHVLGQFVRFSFLGLVGVSMAISYGKVVDERVVQSVVSSGRSVFWRAIFRQWRRALLVFFAAMLVSFVTFLFIPDQYVKFGILHLIAVSIFVLSFVVRWRYLALAFGLIAILVGQWLNGLGTTDSFFSFILGVQSESIVSIDYFPIFPWISVVAFGIFAGSVLYAGKEGRWRLVIEKRLVGDVQRWRLWCRSIFAPISFLGRHSLVVYLLHVPVIVLILWIFGVEIAWWS